MLVVRLPALAEPLELPRRTQDDARGQRVFSRSCTVGSCKPDPMSELAAASPSAGPSPSVVDAPLTTRLPYNVPQDNDIQIPAYARISTRAEHDLRRLYEAVCQARRITVVCGAGVSVSSPANIPDFRSASGLFATLKKRYPESGLSSGKDLFDARLFQSESSTAFFNSMIAELKDLSDAAQPTLFHHMLKRLDREGRLQRVYTQNIDGLEEKAGLTLGFGSPGASIPTSKRKREPVMRTQSRQHLFARSQSDSSVMHGSSTQDRGACQPLFPRAIPLHGSLASMTCVLCSHKLRLERNQTQAEQALHSLHHGEPVWCEQCEITDQLRTEAGLRSRGIGRMKVDVVLYNGENETAEHVGACVERDLLGLRDPCEPDVPETPAETRARERRERQARESANPADAGLGLSILSGEIKAEDALASAFNEEAPDPAVVEQSRRPRRLKPLPPDLLIVAGTSLKVPGTKRIVREFAKACHSRDSERKKEPPVRTVYLNYDFPSAASEWAGVFDMWVQGDVQQASVGLCTPLESKAVAGADPLVESLVAQHSWHAYPQTPSLQGSKKRLDSFQEPVSVSTPASPYKRQLQSLPQSQSLSQLQSQSKSQSQSQAQAQAQQQSRKVLKKTPVAQLGMVSGKLSSFSASRTGKATDIHENRSIRAQPQPHIQSKDKQPRT